MAIDEIMLNAALVGYSADGRLVTTHRQHMRAALEAYEATRYNKPEPERPMCQQLHYLINIWGADLVAEATHRNQKLAAPVGDILNAILDILAQPSAGVVEDIGSASNVPAAVVQAVIATYVQRIRERG